jgi:hypothetical protein
MVRMRNISRLSGLSGFLLIVSIPALSQIGYPGGGVGYPGGGYPGGVGYPGGGGNTGSGIPFPGRRNRTNNDQMPSQTLQGVLQNISNNQLTLASDDRLQTTVMLANNTRFVKASGGNGRISDFQPGDTVSVDASQDNNSVYHAVRVTQVRVGNSDDRAITSGNTSSSSSPSSSSDDDSDRPRLHRADSNTSVNPSPSDKPSDKSSDSASTSSGSSTSSQTVSPRAQINRGDTVQDTPPAPDPSDPGPPQLRRGRPAQTRQTSSEPDTQVADARPSIHAEEVNGVTKMPEPPRVDDTRTSATGSQAGYSTNPRGGGDPVIEQTRQVVFSFSETLPNYVVKQFTTRFATQMATGGKTSWQPLDNVTADVIMENGVERYKNLLVNGKAPREAIEKTGSWSSGEFSSLMQDVFSSPTDAEFHGKRSTRIVNRDAFRYDFSVEQPNSHWHVEAASQTYLPAYTGTVWIDKENSRVLRIEMAATGVPRAFPLDTVESAVDYDYVLIGDSKFLLPVHSEALSCERGTKECSRNVIDFRNYRKFSADTSITFDPNE